MKRLLAMSVAVLAVGCGGGGNGKNEDDLGGAGSGGGGSNGGNQQGAGLEINAALGLDLIDHPWENESNVGGLVLLTRDGEDVVAGAVQVNGVAFPEDSLLTSFYGANGTHVPNTGAGKTLSIQASDEAGTESLDLPCPEEVLLTSPAMGVTVKRGQSLVVKWSGDVHQHNLGFVITPHVTFYQRVGLGGSRWGFTGEGNTIDKGQQQIEVTVPDVSSDELVLELAVPGKITDKSNGKGGEHTGICWLKRRVELKLVD